MVKVGVNVFSPEQITVMGTLRDENGGEIHAENASSLQPGAPFILLNFYGNSSQGRRRLINLTISSQNGMELGHLDESYTTRAYDRTEAASNLARFTGEYDDQGIDSNDDGFYDFLAVSVGTYVPDSGEYTLTGSLFDQRGREIVWGIDHALLIQGKNEMHLDFDGKSIWNSGIDGPYILKNLALSGKNWSLSDITPEVYITQPYNYSQFVDPVYPEKTISGSGQGEILFTFVIEEAIPVFSGRFSQDIVGINIPPISTPFEVNGSRNGYAYQMDGLYMPDKPNNFTVVAKGVKNLNIGLRKDQKPDGKNETRTWVTEQIVAQDGVAEAASDLISPGSYHAKIFGDALDNSSQVLLTLTLDKKIVVNGKFNLSVNTTGFPSGDYSMTAKSLNGSFYLDEIEFGGISMVG
ncbi:MAG: hypothetical protein HPY61_06385 [Methanotrichaceae archaeon]|nr:hypothetical protein [Methanotrichaceae archaeon]